MNFDTDRFVAFDTETALIEPGILAPKLVCGSMADASGGRLLYDGGPGAALAFAKSLLLSSAIIVGANVAFDFGVLAVADPSLVSPIFRAYEEGRVFDVQIAQALHAIAEGNLYQDPETLQPLKGRYSLDRCVRFVLGREDAKARDDWRLRYALLDGVPLEEWSEEARVYPVDDAVNTLEVAAAQVNGNGGGITPGPHRNLGDMAAQAETAWALHLGAMWGLRTDSERVAALRSRAEKDHKAFVERFGKLGFFKPDGEKNTPAVKRALIFAYGGGAKCDVCVGGKTFSEKTGNAINCKACSGTGFLLDGMPKTPTGGLRADRDALTESGDPELTAFGDNEHERTLTTYLPGLESEVIGRWLKPTVLVSTGRTAYDGLIQLMPKFGGERECFRARRGRVLCSVDFSALELCTWAQVKHWLFGYSVMADTINASGDPGILHTALAARMRGWTTEEMVAALKSSDASVKADAKRFRDGSKPPNFGFPGLMGGMRLVLTNRKKGAGSTTAPDGLVYPGVRFCILLAGAERCGVEKMTMWADREYPPTCKHCFQIVHEQIKPAWRDQWQPQRYFDWVAARVEDGGELPCFLSERVRGGLDAMSGANSPFQSLAADGAKHALRQLTRECYGVGPEGRESVLFGSRPIFFVHDEIIAELPEETAHLAGPRMAEVMIKAMRDYVPDVCIKAEPALMRHWSKSAEPAYRDGRLIPWEDRDVA